MWFSVFLSVYSCELQSVPPKNRCSIPIPILCYQVHWARLTLYSLSTSYVPGWGLSTNSSLSCNNTLILTSCSAPIWNPIPVKCFWFLNLVQVPPQDSGSSQPSPFESPIEPPVPMERFSTYSYTFDITLVISIHYASTIRPETQFEHEPVLSMYRTLELW